jgi:4,5-DOPA dioxygenase extradiol
VTKTMPVLFVGHGNPMNAIQNNEFSLEWEKLGKTLPKPKAILCISAHWETWGVLVTAMEKPRTIHDFGGFPPKLYRVQYPAPGSQWLAEETVKAVTRVRVSLDQDWGLDHGCWSVLRRMFPSAELPVVQLSLDSARGPKDHFAIGRELSPLRQEGVLIIASGNMVHNLGRMIVRGDFNEPFGLDWALEANGLFKKLMEEERYDELIDYPSLGRAVQMSVPTAEHYLPMLYALALREKGETVAYFNDKPVAGSLTMTSFRIG